MADKLEAECLSADEVHGMKVKNRFVAGIFSGFVFVSFAQGCAPDPRASGESDVSDVVSRLIKDAPIAKKLNDGEFTAFRERLFLFRHTHVALSNVQTIKPRFAAYLVQAIVASGGIHPDQLHRVLRQLLDHNVDACGGASCARVLGIKPGEINDFLDEILKKLERSRESGESQLSDAQVTVLASSLKRPKMIWHVHDFEVPVPPPRPKSTMPQFDGLCPLPLVQSVGFRSNAGVEMKEMNLTARTMTDSVDYRRQEPPRYQGASGACHTFAMASLLSHSKYSKISASRKLSPERLLVENWAINLGKNPEDAAKKDIEKLHRLAAEFRKDRGVGGSLSTMTPDQATQHFVNKHYIELTIKDQGGNAIRNWYHILEKGALTQDSGVPQLTVGRIEDLTRTLINARLSALRSILNFDLDESTSDGLVKPLVKAYEPIFSAAKEGLRGPRDDIRRELAGFKLKSQIFRRDRADESLGLLIKDLIKYGPAYGSTSSHAFVIVGFEGKNRRFFVRDSQRNSGVTYEEIPADELASRLTFYQVIEPR